MAAKDLRPHQVELLDKIRGSMRRGHKRIMVQASVGFGKTVLASYMIRGAYHKGLSSIFVVPSISLIDQTIERLAEDGFMDVGVMQAMHEMTDCTAPVQVCSAQTLMRREIPKAHLVMIDEAHTHMKFYTDWMNKEEWKNIPFIGLSGTPWARGLGKHYTDLVIGKPMGELIAEKYLSPFRVFAPSTPDLSNVRVERGDYNEDDLEQVMSNPGLTADIVDNWLKNGQGRPTLCFCVNRAHAKQVQMQFESQGVRSAYIDAFTSKEERREIQFQFAENEIDVVCNVGVLTTGVDWDVRCIILARPTRSEMLFCQIIGRGLRTAKGKDDCLIFDHSDNHKRLGFVTDLGIETLDKGERKPVNVRDVEEPLPKECVKCKFLRPPKTPICPNCGFQAEVKSKIQCDDGELVEITKGKNKKAAPTPADMQRWYSMLLHERNRTNKKMGWLEATFRAKFGVAPYGLNEVEVEPDKEVMGYIKHRQIKHAFSRGRPAYAR